MSGTIDRIGTNAARYTRTEDGRVPVFDAVYRRQMIHDPYVIGWSYRLIAQALTVDDDAVRKVLFADELPERNDRPADVRAAEASSDGVL